jgi:hypothetical protein
LSDTDIVSKNSRSSKNGTLAASEISHHNDLSDFLKKKSWDPKNFLLLPQAWKILSNTNLKEDNKGEAVARHKAED